MISQVLAELNSLDSIPFATQTCSSSIVLRLGKSITVRWVCSVTSASDLGERRFPPTVEQTSDTEALGGTLRWCGPLSPMSLIIGPVDSHESYQKLDAAPFPKLHRMKSSARGHNFKIDFQVQESVSTGERAQKLEVLRWWCVCHCFFLVQLGDAMLFFASRTWEHKSWRTICYYVTKSIHHQKYDLCTHTMVVRLWMYNTLYIFVLYCCRGRGNNIHTN